mgnify:CR=1 FL=1
MSTEPQISPTNETLQEEGLNIKALLFSYLRQWPVIILIVVLGLGAAHLYLRYQPKIFEVKAKILFTNQEKNAIEELSVFSDLGLSNKMGAKLANEIAQLKTPGILRAVVRELKLRQSVVLLGRKTGLSKSEFYPNAPFEIIPIAMKDSIWQNAAIQFSLVIKNQDQFELIQGDRSLGVFKYEAPIATAIGTIKIHNETQHRFIKADEYIVSLDSEKSAMIALDNALTFTADNDAENPSDVVTINLTGPLVRKMEDIIWSLLKNHRLEKIADQNQIARNTSDFINERMRIIEDELNVVEGNAEGFKARHELVNILSDGQSFAKNRDELDKEIITQSVQLSLIQYLKDYLREHQENTELLPGNLGFEDGSLVAITAQYNKLVLDRIRLAKTSSAKNPSIQKLDDQIEGLRFSLAEGLKSNESKLRIALKSLKEQDARYQGQIRALPGYERQFRDIEREQKIKEALYVFLLEKREENEIKTASAVGNTKLIMEPVVSGPISPKNSIAYLMALALGISLPLAYVYLKQLMDNKVHGLQECAATRIPALGEIPLAEDLERNIVVTKNARTHIAEAFRMVRSNLNFLLGETEEGRAKVLLVSSSVAKEGKTFVSINLGHALAQGNSKVLVVGLDLRAPKIGRYVNIEKAIGVTNFIVNEELSFDDLLINDPGNSDLQYIISGDVPPNPSELLMRERITELMTEAKKRYDYIILDTAPLGLVSDSLHIQHFADLVIYVVRAELIKKVMGTFFPKRTIVGLSFQSNDSNLVLVSNLQFTRFTSLTNVITPLRLNSLIVYNSTPSFFVPIRYFTLAFNGSMVLIFPSASLELFSIVIGASFQIFISISSSSIVLSS